MFNEGPLYELQPAAQEPERIDETLAATRAYECAKLCQLSPSRLLKASRYISELLVEQDECPTGQILLLTTKRPS